MRSYVVVGVTDNGTWYRAQDAVWFSDIAAAEVRDTGVPVVQLVEGYTVIYVYVPESLSVTKVKAVLRDIGQVVNGSGVVYLPRVFGRGVAYGIVLPIARVLIGRVPLCWIDGYKTF